MEKVWNFGFEKCSASDRVKFHLFGLLNRVFCEKFSILRTLKMPISTFEFIWVLSFYTDNQSLSFRELPQVTAPHNTLLQARGRKKYETRTNVDFRILSNLLSILRSKNFFLFLRLSEIKSSLWSKVKITFLQVKSFTFSAQAQTFDNRICNFHLHLRKYFHC